MDPEEQQQTSVAPDVATGDLAAVIAAAERGEYNQRADAEPTGEAQATASDQTQEPQVATAPEPAASTQQAPPAEVTQQAPAEDWQRKYHSVAGNNSQLQQQLRQSQAQFEQERQQFQQQLLQFQRQQALAQEEARIRADTPAEYADEAVKEFRANKAKEFEQAEFSQGAEAYRQYLLQQQTQLEETKVEIFRNSLPAVFPDLARYVAQQTSAPDEGLVALAGTEAMNEVYKMVGQAPARGVSLAQRDLDLISAVMAGFGQVEAQRDATRKRGNAQVAVAEGAFRTEPDGSGRGSGLNEVERIKAMPDKDFDKMIAELRGRHGG